MRLCVTTRCLSVEGAAEKEGQTDVVCRLHPRFDEPNGVQEKREKRDRSRPEYAVQAMEQVLCYNRTPGLAGLSKDVQHMVRLHSLARPPVEPAWTSGSRPPALN